MLNAYPFVSLPQAMAVARVVTALLFMAHAAVRIVHGTIPQFGKFLSSVGFPQGEAVVWAITAVELVAGSLLIVNRQVRVASVALMVVAVGGILLIHMHIGWFVGEHGTGGSEYSVALILLLIVVAAAARPAGSDATQL